MSRPGLTKEKIATAALKLADRDGLDTLSMRKLADALGVGTMSLYNHVQDKADLERLMQDMVFAAMPMAKRSGPWQTRVVGAMDTIRSALNRHPGLAPLLLKRSTISETALQPIEAILAALHSGGFRDMTLLRAYHTLLAYLIGFLLSDLNGALSIKSKRTAADVAKAVLELDDERFPHLRAAAKIAKQSRSDDEFAFGLTAVLAGLAKAKP